MSILLVDGNNLTMRGVHAMARSVLSVDGVPTGPLLVVINALSRHIREEKPDKVVVCWDSGPSRFRLALNPDYKGQRTQNDPEFNERKEGTFALVKEFLSLANIHQVERPGYEADDLIAWYVDYYRTGAPIPNDPGPMERREKVTILSSDKDFLQLLGPSVHQIRFANGGEPADHWDEARVREQFGCEPKHLTLAMALAGDSVDNVPGVPRYGMKTAIKHLSQAEWSLEVVRKVRPVVEGHWDQVMVSLALVDLWSVRREMNLSPLPPFNPTKPGNILWESLLSFLLHYQMETVKKRLYKASLWSDLPE